MSEMQGATEYRDAWRGLRIMVPAGWEASRSGTGLIVHDPTGERAVVVQPRPGAPSADALEQDLLAWLKRFDAQAELHAEPAGETETRVCNACMRAGPGRQALGVFALQMRPGGGLISGYLAPALTYEADSRTAVAVLATLAAIPPQVRILWREPSEGACSALVPQAWRVEGRVNRSNPAGIAAAGLQAWADDTTGVMASAEGRLFMEPGLLGAVMGSLAGGMIGQGRFADAAGYAEAYLLPELRREASDARLEGVTVRPGLVPMAVARQAAANGLSPAALLQGEPSAAEVTLAFRSHGAAVRQRTQVITMRVPPAMSRGLSLWMASIPYSYRAPVERFEALEPVLEGIASSFHVNPEWQRREEARLPRAIGCQLATVRGRAQAEQLLEEAEGLVCARLGRPLAFHERAFRPQASEQAALGEPPQPGLALYEQSIWQGLDLPV